MGSFAIRLAVPGDEAGVKAATRRAYQTVRDVYRPKGRALSDRVRERPEYDTLVGELDAEIVAVVEYRLEQGSLHLRSLGVAPAHRHRGLARRMIHALEGIARTRERSALTLYTIRETGNVEFFEGLGFTVVAEEVATWCESDRYERLHDVRMTRTLM